MSTFYPSCVVHLVVRFDEALIAGASVPKAVSTEEAARLPASVVLPDAEKPLLAQKMSSGGFTNDGESSFVLNIVPKRCSVEKGGVRAAGTFNIQLAWQDLPLDPRTIRALGVEVHMGTVSAEDFARGMDGDRRADGSLYSILRTRDPGGRLRAGTLVMLGIADEVSEEYGQDGIGLTITGRDQRGILLSSPLPPDALNKLDYSRAIPEIIVRIRSVTVFNSSHRARIFFASSLVMTLSADEIAIVASMSANSCTIPLVNGINGWFGGKLFGLRI